MSSDGAQEPPLTHYMETAGCHAASHSLSERELATDVQKLSAMNNDSRYEILRFIAESDTGHCICELEPELDVSQGAISQALSRLFSAGLVERRKVGRWRYYDTSPTADKLLTLLDELRSTTNE